MTPDVSRTRENFPARQASGLAALGRLASHHTPTRTAGQPFLTAFLPAHNEAGTIVSTIWSLQTQTRPPDRIIVVCDNCTDETADLATLTGAEVMFSVGNTHKKAGAL